MANIPFAENSIFVAPPLSVEELEAGLRQLDRGEIASDTFWDENLTAFRQAMLAAIGETSDMLAGRLPYRWRREFEVQIEALRGYVDIVDVYIARRGAAAGGRLN
jgi:hypothetical protein